MFGEVKEEKIWNEITKELIYMLEEYEKKMQRVIWSIKWNG
jgi:hypothetical protein